MKTLLGILVVAILSIIFTLQNVLVVPVKALFWTFESPLALVIAISLAFGVVLGILISIYAFVIKKDGSDKKDINKNGKKYYQCEECGLKYANKEIAEKCQAWCKEHKSCNLDIIKHAVTEVHKS